MLLLLAAVTAVPLIFSWSISGQTSSTTVYNPRKIKIGFVGPANPYGATIDVDLRDTRGQTALITNLAVTISQFTHKSPEDVDLLLVGPRGQSTLLLSDVGRVKVAGQTLTFDQRAAQIPQDPITSGRYQPVDIDVAGDSDSFPGLTSFAYPVDLSVFNGTDPNGRWTLYVVDDSAGFKGKIKGGWGITFTTDRPVAGAAALLDEQP